MIPSLKQTVCIDYETFWSADFTLSKLSTSEYVRDERFKVHTAAISIGGKKPKVVWGHDNVGRALQAIDWTTHGLLAQNTLFDGFITSEVYGIKPCFYFDTKSMAAGMFNGVVSNSLESLAQIYGVGVKNDESLQSTKGMDEIPLEWRERFAQYNSEDCQQCFDIFKHQIASFPEAELRVIDLVIRMFCDSPLLVDTDRARAALAEEAMWRRATMLAAKQVFHKRGTKAYDNFDIEPILMSNDKFAEALSRFIDPPTKISKKTGQLAWAFSKTDEEFLLLEDSEELEVALLVRARLAAKSTQSETRAYRLLEAGRDGMNLPVGYNYSAAKTHRLGGTNSLNLQNLERGSELRKSIIAMPQHVLCVADSAQIEARMLAWLCGQLDVLDAFASGTDVYRRDASIIFGKNEDAITKGERFIGKIVRLGLGYGMGHKKFRTTLALGTMGPPVYITLGEAQRIVNLYRGTNLKIVQGWKEGERILHDMIAGNTGTGFNDLIRYEPGTVWLPNGMPIHYPNLRYSESGNMVYSVLKGKGKSKTIVDQKIYGGKFIENLVQALARIVVFDQILMVVDYLKTLRLRKGEVAKVVMTTHDEIVAHVPERFAEKVQAKMVEVMRVPPEWATDLPLDAEAGYAREYSK
jgi:DNA polymerase